MGSFIGERYCRGRQSGINPDGGIALGHQQAPYSQLLSKYAQNSEVKIVENKIFTEAEAARVILQTKLGSNPLQQPDLLANNLDMFEQLAIAPNQQSKVHFDLKNNDEANENSVADTSEISSALDVNPLQIELITESDKQADKNTEEMRSVQIQQKYGAIFELFVNTLISLSKDKTSFFILDDIKNQFPELQDTQIKKWLKELETEGCLRKEGRKARYTFV